MTMSFLLLGLRIEQVLVFQSCCLKEIQYFLQKIIHLQDFKFLPDVCMLSSSEGTTMTERLNSLQKFPLLIEERYF